MWLLTKDIHFECFILLSYKFAPRLLGTLPGSGQLCMLCCYAMHATHTHTHTHICIMVDILPGIHTCGQLDSVSSDGYVDGSRS